jgi:hypothetical protein
MRDAQPQVAENPFEGAKVVGHQLIWPARDQQLTKPSEVGDASAFANRNPQQLYCIAAKSLGSPVAAVHGDNRMPELVTERVGDLDKTAFWTAKIEGGEGMKDMARCHYMIDD